MKFGIILKRIDLPLFQIIQVICQLDKETILSIRTTGEIVNSFATIKDFIETEIGVAEQMMIATRDENGN